MDETCEGCADLATGAGPQNASLQPDGDAGRLQFSQRDVAGRFAWVDEYSYANRVRRQGMQELQPLCGQLRRQNAHACHIAARLGEAGDKTQIHRVIGGIKDDGKRRGCCLGRQWCLAASGRDNETNPPTRYCTVI